MLTVSYIKLDFHNARSSEGIRCYQMKYSFPDIDGMMILLCNKCSLRHKLFSQ